jgi:hypothetical protein
MGDRRTHDSTHPHPNPPLEGEGVKLAGISNDSNLNGEQYSPCSGATGKPVYETRVEVE